MVDNYPLTLESALTEAVPATVAALIQAVIEAAPPYRALFESGQGEQIRLNIDIALRTFVALAFSGPPTDREGLVRPAWDAAFRLGRDEALVERGTESILTAFRVGGRAAWQHIGSIAADCLDPHQVAGLAELLFGFVDQMSEATVAGHSMQASLSIERRDRERARIVESIVLGRAITPEETAVGDWPVPAAFVLAVAELSDFERVRGALGLGAIVARRTGSDTPDHCLGIVETIGTASRQQVLKRLRGLPCVLSPSTGTEAAPTAYLWTLRLFERRLRNGRLSADVDASAHLVDIALEGERALIESLRTSLLSPLDQVPSATRERLEETLERWLAYRGRHDLVAEAMHVHPQTVRYRIGRLQSLLGEHVFADPDLTLALHLALAGRPGVSA